MGARATVPYRALTGHSLATACAGALAIALSGILYRLSATSPDTAAFFRCLYALPVLAVLARMEAQRRPSALGRRQWLGYLAGVLFAADLILWHRSVEAVGAGLGTVLANLQVVFVTVLAWMLLDERPSLRVLAAVPIALGGALLISGVLEQGAYGEDPLLGVVYGIFTGLAYAGFLLILRGRGADRMRPATPLWEATVSATLILGIFGLVAGTADFVPTWPEHGWLLLLALESQVVGWVLITVSLPGLPAALGSVTLLLQPVAAVILAAALLSELPSRLQLAGSLLILLALLTAHSGRRTQRAADAESARSHW